MFEDPFISIVIYLFQDLLKKQVGTTILLFFLTTSPDVNMTFAFLFLRCSMLISDF